MNKAGSQARTIDRDQAAALMEPLTDLVIKAGQPILAVNRRGIKIVTSSMGRRSPKQILPPTVSSATDWPA